MAAEDRTDAARPDGVAVHPFRALRPTASDEQLGELLCPPYDVIDTAARDQLLQRDPDNAVAIVLPDPTPAGYRDAADHLAHLIAAGSLAVDPTPTIYVYEMADELGATRGFVGAVDLRDPADGVILPHENTMAGPVADRLAVMTATDTDLEPIYLIYDGGGPASQLLAEVGKRPPLARASTPDGLRHTLWRLEDPDEVATVAADLGTRRALIADGHHRYATYRERQRLRGLDSGTGPWDQGMALLVDSTRYGPQVHAIHRVVPGLPFDDAVALTELVVTVRVVDGTPDEALREIAATPGFAAVLSDGTRSAVISDPAMALARLAAGEGEADALAALDVTILHRVVIERVWRVSDDVEHVDYAHSVTEALDRARRAGGVAVLLRPTPADAVAAVAAAGSRMPRKSTLFTPKPASGLLMRRLSDQTGPAAQA